MMVMYGDGGGRGGGDSLFAISHIVCMYIFIAANLINSFDKFAWLILFDSQVRCICGTVTTSTISRLIKSYLDICITIGLSLSLSLSLYTRLVEEIIRNQRPVHYCI